MGCSFSTCSPPVTVARMISGRPVGDIFSTRRIRGRDDDGVRVGGSTPRTVADATEGLHHGGNPGS